MSWCARLLQAFWLLCPGFPDFKNFNSNGRHVIITVRLGRVYEPVLESRPMIKEASVDLCQNDPASLLQLYAFCQNYVMSASTLSLQLLEGLRVGAWAEDVDGWQLWGTVSEG